MSSTKHSKTSEIVFTFLCDTAYGAILFLGVFSIAFMVSEALILFNASFNDSGWVLWAAKVVKGFMLVVDTLLMMVFIARQGWYGCIEMWS